MASLEDLLNEVEGRNIDREGFQDRLQFSMDVVEKLCDVLGIDQDFLYIRPNIGEGLMPDGLIQINASKKPWAVFEAVPSDSESLKDRAVGHVRKYLHYTDAELAAIVGKGYIVVLDSEGTILHDVDSNAESELRKINHLLSPPDEFVQTAEAEEPDRNSTQEYVSKPNYEIDLVELENALDAVDAANSNQEKKETFEELAELLFDAIPFLTVRQRNQLTNTSEIDLTIEYMGWDKRTIFDDWSKFILVECKNWSGSVGAKQIRDFKGKMDKTQVDIGVIFARNGITGDESANAIGEIHSYYDRAGNMILVIGDNELNQLLEGRSFYDLLDDLMYQLRFDSR